MDKVNYHFPYLARFVHNCSYESNKALFTAADFCK